MTTEDYPQLVTRATDPRFLVWWPDRQTPAEAVALQTTYTRYPVTGAEGDVEMFESEHHEIGSAADAARKAVWNAYEAGTIRHEDEPQRVMVKDPRGVIHQFDVVAEMVRQLHVYRVYPILLACCILLASCGAFAAGAADAAASSPFFEDATGWIEELAFLLGGAAMGASARPAASFLSRRKAARKKVAPDPVA